MSNIFKQNKEINEHPNRNNFDLSHKSNVSLKMGTLYPVMCQPVVPGDSFDINVAYNLKLMPVVFPVQTKMRAHMHFFYVRNKNLWKGWQNWISNLRDNSVTPHPYLAPAASKVKTGSLYDFLGVPTTFVGERSITGGAPYIPYSSGRPLYCVQFMEIPSVGDLFGNVRSESYALGRIPIIPYGPVDSLNDGTIDGITFSYYGGDFDGVSPTFATFDTYVYKAGSSPNTSSFLTVLPSRVTYDGEKINVHFLTQSPEYSICQSVINNGDKLLFAFAFNSLKINDTDISLVDFEMDIDTPQYGGVFEYSYSLVGFQQYSDTDFSLYSDNLHINALPFRAYESCYNAYYRNNVVTPLTDDNNQPLYNQYLVNDGDGLDTFDYQLHQRNYELDFLTSALPSPQQGVAPLVGMTALGDITIEDENGLTTAHAEVDDAGTITKVVLTSPAASNEHARTAMNIAASGMSINDFRNTNALVRLLETNIRKGYRYIDFIAGHFGKEPEYRELDMPEFIGGFSRDVNVSTVVSQSDTLSDGGDTGAALGQYGGYASLVGGSQHSVRHYCDDYGYIIGILSVVPTPCYSQLLPKHMIAPDNFLDYYFPEFSQTGLQPITYKEVTPIQAYLQHLVDQSTSLTDTFGYQRPNYDMIAAVDEVHGEFRGSLRNFVINRIFAMRPELGRDFLAIRPEEINDIFVNQNPDEDTIIGEIGFQVYAKRPVPRVVIPNLGR